MDGLVALLKRKGFKAIPSHGGDEALTVLTTVTPDLILLDIMMEPMDGWETLDRIKANPATKDIPVLMFSAKKITPDEAEQHCLNIEDFVSKPVNPSSCWKRYNGYLNGGAAVTWRRCWQRMQDWTPATIEEYSALGRASR